MNVACSSFGKHLEEDGATNPMKRPPKAPESWQTESGEQHLVEQIPGPEEESGGRTQLTSSSMHADEAPQQQAHEQGLGACEQHVDEPVRCLQHLPPELWHAIVALGGFNGSIRQACRQLVALHDAAVNEMTLVGFWFVESEQQTQWQGQANFKALQRQLRQLKQQRLADLTRLVTRCTGVRSLMLQQMTEKELRAVLLPVAGQRLQQLTLESCEFRTRNLHCCSSLQHLTVDLCYDSPYFSLEQRHTLPGLRTLTVASQGFDSVYCGGLLPQALTKLDIHCYSEATLGVSSTSLAALTSLQELRLSDEVAFMGSFKCGPLSTLTALQRLDVAAHSCVGVTVLSGLTQLSRLALPGMETTDNPSHLSTLASLAELCLCNFNTLQPVQHLTRLTSLEFHYTFRQVHLPVENILEPLSRMTQLRQLDLIHGEDVAGLDFLAPLQHLQQLRISTITPNLDALAHLTQLVELQVCALSGDSAPTSLQPLASLTRLRDLTVNHVPAMDLTPLGDLTLLQGLALRNCKHVERLAPLSGLVRLEGLVLDGCFSIRDLCPLSNLTQLRQLEVSDCKHISSLEGLEALAGLRRLSVAKCELVRDLIPLAGLTRLQELSITDSPLVTSLEGVGAMARLEQLSVCSCDKLQDMAPVAALTQLRRLDIHDSPLIASLAPIADLQLLQRLDLFDCTGVACLGPLRGLAQLRRLCLCGCTGVTDVSPLGGLRLRSLHVDYKCHAACIKDLALSHVRHFSIFNLT